MNFTAPLSSPLPAAAFAANAAARQYHWEEIAAQNANVSALIRAAFPSVVEWDVATATMLRPDRHSYHIPGPVQEWVRSFYNLLRVLDDGRVG